MNRRDRRSRSRRTSPEDGRNRATLGHKFGRAVQSIVLRRDAPVGDGRDLGRREAIQEAARTEVRPGLVLGAVRRKVEEVEVLRRLDEVEEADGVVRLE